MKIKSQYGFTLTEVMISLGASVILMLGISSAYITNSRQNQMLQQRMELIEVEQAFRGILNNRNTCDCIFKELNKFGIKMIPRTSNGRPFPLPPSCLNGLSFPDSKTGLVLNSMTIGNVLNAGNDLVSLEIHLKFGNYPALVVNQTVRVDDAKLPTSCQTTMNSDFSTLCKDLFPLSTLDPVTGKCIVPPGTANSSPNFTVWPIPKDAGPAMTPCGPDGKGLIFKVGHSPQFEAYYHVPHSPRVSVCCYFNGHKLMPGGIRPPGDPFPVTSPLNMRAVFECN